MKSPRFLRPHSVQVEHISGEDDKGKPIKNTITVDYVSVDTSYGVKQSNKGVMSDDTAVMIVDLLDLVVDGKPSKSIKIYDNDTVYFDKKEFKVSKVVDVFNPLARKSEMLEVYMHG